MTINPSLHDAYLNIAKLIKSSRKAIGLSQVQLAEATALSRATIQELEAAKANITFETLSKVANYLDISYAEIIGDRLPKEKRDQYLGSEATKQLNAISKGLVTLIDLNKKVLVSQDNSVPKVSIMELFGYRYSVLVEKSIDMVLATGFDGMFMAGRNHSDTLVCSKMKAVKNGRGEIVGAAICIESTRDVGMSDEVCRDILEFMLANSRREVVLYDYDFKLMYITNTRQPATLEQLLGRNFVEQVVGADDVAAVGGTFRAAMTAGKPTTIPTIRVELPDGQSFDLDTKLYPFEQDGRLYACSAALLKPVSPVRLAEEA